MGDRRTCSGSWCEVRYGQRELARVRTASTATVLVSRCYARGSQDRSPAPDTGREAAVRPCRLRWVVPGSNRGTGGTQNQMLPRGDAECLYDRDESLATAMVDAPPHR
jgi:hypothetical protein